MWQREAWQAPRWLWRRLRSRGVERRWKQHTLHYGRKLSGSRLCSLTWKGKRRVPTDLLSLETMVQFPGRTSEPLLGTAPDRQVLTSLRKGNRTPRSCAVVTRCGISGATRRQGTTRRKPIRASSRRQSAGFPADKNTNCEPRMVHDEGSAPQKQGEVVKKAILDSALVDHCWITEGN